MDLIRGGCGRSGTEVAVAAWGWFLCVAVIVAVVAVAWASK